MKIISDVNYTWSHRRENIPEYWKVWLTYWPALIRFVESRVAHALWMPETFSPQSRVSDPDMYHGTCVMHVSWCMLRSLTSGFHWIRWREERSWHSRRMCCPQFYVSGKRPIPAFNPTSSDQVLNVTAFQIHYSIQLIILRLTFYMKYAIRRESTCNQHKLR